MVGDLKYETNFLHKLLLTNAQVSKVRKTFTNGSSAKSKILLSKMVQLEGFLGRLFGPLLKTCLFLMKKELKPSAKCFLIPLRLKAEESTTDAVIWKKVIGSRMQLSDLPQQITLITSNKEIGVIMKINVSLEESDLLIESVSETIQQLIKEQKNGFLSMLLDSLGASLLRNILTGTVKQSNLPGRGVKRAGKEQLEQARIFNATASFKQFWKTKVLSKWPKFNNVSSLKDLLKIKDETYVTNLDDYKSIGTHWIALYVNGNNATYFSSFWVEHIPKEIKILKATKVSQQIFIGYYIILCRIILYIILLYYIVCDYIV